MRLIKYMMIGCLLIFVSCQKVIDLELREAGVDQTGVQHLRACAGHTVDISQHGLAVVLHAQNIDEQYLLDLEREAFLKLCGEPKTLERIQYTLKTGKTLRN